MILWRALFSELRFHLPGRPCAWDGCLIPFLLSTMGSWSVPGKRLTALCPQTCCPSAGRSSGTVASLPLLESLDYPQLEMGLPPLASC